VRELRQRVAARGALERRADVETLLAEDEALAAVRDRDHVERDAVALGQPALAGVDRAQQPLAHGPEADDPDTHAPRPHARTLRCRAHHSAPTRSVGLYRRHGQDQGSRWLGAERREREDLRDASTAGVSRCGALSLDDDPAAALIDAARGPRGSWELVWRGRLDDLGAVDAPACAATCRSRQMSTR
jgi:hypothetical protein